MATDLDGSPLLAVLLRPQARLMAFTITTNTNFNSSSSTTANCNTSRVSTHGVAATPVHGTGAPDPAAAPAMRVALAGVLEGVASMAALAATGLQRRQQKEVFGGCGDGGGDAAGAPFAWRHSDLVVLSTAGRLLLYRGAS